MKPTVSIILTTRNQASCLWRTILSVLAQTEERWELLVIDRGSNDCTADLMREFGDPKIRYLRAETSSVAAARAHGLKHAQGEYIAYLEPEAGWAPEFLQRMLAVAESDPHGLLWYCREARYLYETRPDGTLALCGIGADDAQTYSFDDAVAMRAPAAHRWLHRRTLLDLVGGWDADCQWFEDQDLFGRALGGYAAYVHAVSVTLAERRVALASRRTASGAREDKDMYRQVAGRRYLREKWRRLPVFQSRQPEWN